jgi:hypothetical protein
MWTMGCLISLWAQAQKKWDGGAGTMHWQDDANWYPDGAPLPADDVWLDNSRMEGSYRVLLPAGPVSTAVSALTIMPSSGVITLELPPGNTANPGLSIGGALSLHPQAIFINGSGASAGSGITVTGPLRIFNGGKYIHRTGRANASLIDRLQVDAATEKGMFEFDVPGTAGYTVSLTGNNFGSLCFRAAAAGGAKSYSGSGSGTLTVRGDLCVDTGVQLTSTLTADIVVSGNLILEGRLNLNPSTSGSVARSLRFTGRSALRGSGQLGMNGNFRAVDVSKAASLFLERDLVLGHASQSVVVRGELITSLRTVGGPGNFTLHDSATLWIGDPNGIFRSENLGNIRTALRQYSAKGIYVYQGTGRQQTGDGLPDSVSALGIQNEQGLALTRGLYVRDSLLLGLGRIHSTPVATLVLGSPVIRSPVNGYGRADEGHEGSFITGPLGLHLLPDSLMVAPVGSDTVFAPVRFRSRDPGREVLTLTYFREPAPGASPDIPGLSDREYWKLDRPLASRVEPAISLRPWSLGTDPLSRPTLAAKAAQWFLLPGPGTGSGYRWLQGDSLVKDVQAMAPALVREIIVLPLQLLHFGIREVPEGLRLSWEAEEQGKPLYYRILRSGDGLSFTEIGRLHSPGRGRASHQWLDTGPLSIGYYRLVMVGEGREIPGRVIRMERLRASARVYPNPASDRLNIFFPGSRSGYRIEIVSVYGNVCTKFVCYTATSEVRVGDLKKGVYLVRITDGNRLFTLPFFKD